MKNLTLWKLLPGALAALMCCAVSPLKAQTADSQAVPNAPGEVTTGELPANIVPGSPLAQIVQMAQAGVDESVIMSFIQNSASPFNLTSDQIIYLKDLGLPDEAINAMIQRDQQLGASAATQAPATTEVTSEQPVEVTQNYFYDTLTPYGGWVNVEGYGLCWRPTVVIYDSSWQPYCQHGHWVYTDCGWYWLSDYSWGSCAFHYGRWFHDPHFGWCWWPDRTWGPSWVCWRYSNDYCGWAPLPPRCVYRPGVGIVFNGAVVSANFNFGIGANFYTFVPTRNFCDPHPAHFRVGHNEAVTIYNHTTVIHDFNEGSHHLIVNHGIPHERIAAVSPTPIRQFTIQENSTPGFHGERMEHNRDVLFVHRPDISENAASALNRGVRPRVIAHENAPHPPTANRNQNQQGWQNSRAPQNPTMGAPAPNNFSPRPDENSHRAGNENPHNAPNQNPPNNFSPAPGSVNPTERSDWPRQLSPRQQQFEDQNRRPNNFNQRESTPPRQNVDESRHDNGAPANWHSNNSESHHDNAAPAHNEQQQSRQQNSNGGNDKDRQH